MVKSFTPLLTVTAAFALAMLAPMAVEAQSLADRDAKEVADYVLTETALTKYTQSVRSLPMKEQLPQTCEGDEHLKSLNDQAAKMDSVPSVKSALKAAGMTSREYLVVSFSVFQSGMAAWALDQPGGTLPPGMKPANVNFYRAHKTELEKLGELTKQADCDNSNR